MDETLLRALTAFGLSEKESAVYLAALQAGRSPASTLARKAGLNRVTTYTLLQQLKEKMVIQSVEHKGVTHFFVVPPEVLFARLEEKYHVFKEQLPAFAALAEQFDRRPKMQYFEWIAGLKTMYNDLLTSTVPLCSFLWTQAIAPALSEYLYHDFLPRRIAALLKAKVLLWPDPENKQYVGNDKKTLKQCKIIHDAAFAMQIEINLYGPNKVAFALFSDDEMSGFVIESPKLFASMMSIFTVLWKSA